MPKAPPLWYFGAKISGLECAKALKEGATNTFCVRVGDGGDTAFLMIHDHEVNTSGKVDSKIVELKITEVKAGKFLFKGKPHKSVDEIVANLRTPKNGFKAKSGRKVWCGEPADRPAPAAGGGKKKKEIPPWFFGSKIEAAKCATAIRAGEHGTFCVRNDPDGDTAYLMIHDKGEKDGKMESKICEYKITQIKARKYVFKGREHKDVDTIIDNLTALSNAFSAKSGRKVYCKEPAVRPGGGAGDGKKKKAKKAKKAKKGAAAAEAEEESEEESDHEIQHDAVDNDTGVGFDAGGIPDPDNDEYQSSDDGGGGGGDAPAAADDGEDEEVGGFSDDE